jgi:hypothetical protein
MRAARLLMAACIATGAVTAVTGTAAADVRNDAALHASDEALRRAAETASADKQSKTAAVQQAINDKFADIKPDHWSYQAVKQLSAEGLIDGPGSGYFNGDQPLTRYEMASIIARALAKEKDANIEQKIVIDKLSEAYHQELQSIGNQMAMMNEKIDRVQFHGYLGYRYDHQQGLSFFNPVVKNTFQLSVDVTYRQNKHLAITMQNVYNRSFLSEAADYSENGSLLWADYHNRDLAVRAGRFTTTAGYGLMFNDEKIQGVQVTYGKRLKVKATAAQYKPITDIEAESSSQFVNNLVSHNNHPALSDGSLFSLELNYAADAKTNFKGVFQTKPDTKNFIGSDGSPLYARWESVGTRFLELGFDRSLGHDTKLIGVWSHSNAPDGNNAYKAQLEFGQAWPPLKGKHCTTLAYYYAPASAMIIGGSGGLIGDYVSMMGEGFKGALLGWQFSPVDYHIFDIFYLYGDTASDASPFGALLPAGTSKKVFRVEYTVLF